MTERETYALLDYAGDVGGTIDFIYLIGFLIAKGLFGYKFLSLIANRMYIWEADTNQ